MNSKCILKPEVVSAILKWLACYGNTTWTHYMTNFNSSNQSLDIYSSK